MSFPDNADFLDIGVNAKSLSPVVGVEGWDGDATGEFNFGVDMWSEFVFDFDKNGCAQSWVAKISLIIKANSLLSDSGGMIGTYKTKGKEGKKLKKIPKIRKNRKLTEQTGQV